MNIKEKIVILTVSLVLIISLSGFLSFSNGSISAVAGTSLTKNPYAVNTQQTQAHGLGTTPSIVEVYLECLIAEAGYNVGDRVLMPTGSANGAGIRSFSVYFNTTNLGLNTSANLPQVVNNANTYVTITAANWKLVAIPFK